MKQSWMTELETHYEKTRRQYPKDKLMILFDIDGTILDMRYMVLHVLQAFDNAHSTRFFLKLQTFDIKVHENQVHYLLADLQISAKKQKEILDWYNQNRWASKYILNSHNPFSGVLEVIRWFELQPNTFVGLNTGRPESLRGDTLRSLNELGKKYKVHFSDDLLHMNPQDWDQEVENSKVAGVRHFQKAGYRIFAFVDNEPANLKAVSQIVTDREILLLHANTLFESKRIRLPAHTVRGKEYDLTELIPERALPRHIQFVWHGINDEVNLRQFLTSDIGWGECDVRLDPISNQLILRHDSFVENPLELDEEWFGVDRLFERLLHTGKSIKFDLKAGGILVDKVLELIKSHSFDESRLWFNGNVERLHKEGFRKLAGAYPNAIMQCPVDFLAPLISSAPTKAKDIIDMFISWGINRFSINWMTEDMRTFFDQMDKWELEVNIYNVSDLASFLQAVLLMPRSITSDFNFPKWHYYGRGSGQHGEHYEYSVHKVKTKK